MQPTTDIFIKIAYALGIGLLIGLERSILQKPVSSGSDENKIHKKQDNGSDEILGVRTYTLLSLSGYLAALIGDKYPAVMPVIIAGILILIIALYIKSSNKDFGITTELSAITCCGLGLLCYSSPFIAGVLALITTVILAMKRFLENTLKKIHRIELIDTLKFLAIILIVLPLLPNRALDPLQVFNPYKVMFLVILISGISFVGYFLTKFLGAQRGLGLTGLLGGLTSSTAVTAAMSNQAKEEPELHGPCTFAIIIANATMFARVLVVVAVLDFQLMKRLAMSIGAMTIVATIAVIFLWLKSKKNTAPGEKTSKELVLKNPFSLGPAIKFAFFFVIILFTAKIAKQYLGNSGLYLASLVSGLADVDAITLSIAEQTKGSALEYSVGAIGITIAVVSNSIVKSSIAIYSGGWKFGRSVGVILMAATLAGLCVLLVF